MIYLSDWIPPICYGGSGCIAPNHCAGKVVSPKQENVSENIVINFCGNGTVIVTENSDGEIYMITAEYIQDILDDWNGDCNFVPANDARVFFAAWNGRPPNPYCYSDFESLLRLLNIAK